MKKLFLVCALTLFAILPAIAADNPWIGTWKLDPAKSHFTGDTFTYSKAANGMMQYSNGSTIKFEFAIDGKEYKSVYDRTVTWTTAGDNAWDTVYKANGKVLSKSHRQISPDGKTMTITNTGTRPDGTTFTNDLVFTRVTGTNGLVGEWRTTKVTISAPDSVVVSSLSPGIMHWDYPAFKYSFEGKFDGTDLPVTGPTAPSGTTISCKMLSAQKISYENKVAGKITGYGLLTLAADGKTFTDASWDPGKESEKETSFYEKQ